MLPSDTSLPAALEGEYGCWRCGMKFANSEEGVVCPSCHSACVKRLAAAELALRYVDVPHSVDNVHAGHGARTQHLRDELARAGRRRASFTTR